jgi:hypothetical protein
MSQNIKSYLDVAPVVVASQHKHTPFGCFRRQVKKLEIDSKHLTKIKKNVESVAWGGGWKAVQRVHRLEYFF